MDRTQVKHFSLSSLIDRTAWQFFSMIGGNFDKLNFHVQNQGQNTTDQFYKERRVMFHDKKKRGN